MTRCLRTCGLFADVQGQGEQQWKEVKDVALELLLCKRAGTNKLDPGESSCASL